MKRLLIDKNISDFSKNYLAYLGFKLFETGEISEIKSSISTHPDMQICMLEKNKALVYDGLFDYYSFLFPDISFIKISDVGAIYPNDCILNIASVGENIILTKFQYEKLKRFISGKKTIFTKQGYSKCSTCILNSNAILSADRGICKSVEKSGIKAYYLPDDEITLKGFKNGFWGGCSGLIGDGKLFFNGNIENLSCFDELCTVLNKEKIEPLYIKDIPLTDNGSIMLIDI